MKVTVISVGKIKEKYLKLGIAEFEKRLSKYCKLNLIEVSDEKTAENMSQTEEKILKGKEGERILKNIKPSAYVIALAIDGKQRSSEELSEWISQLAVQGNSHFVFVIGGSIGLANVVMERANAKLSFSKMTFPHQMMKLILLEQIYRSYRIMNGEPYHK